MQVNKQGCQQQLLFNAGKKQGYQQQLLCYAGKKTGLPITKLD